MHRKLVHIAFLFLLANIMLVEVCTMYNWFNSTQLLLIEEEDHKDHNDFTKKVKKKSFEEFFTKNADLLHSFDAFLRSKSHSYEFILHSDPLIEIHCPPPNNLS